MPKIVDHEDTRRSIREAAWRVFAERGVKGTGLEHVATAAGVGRSSLYHYYPSKQSLLSSLTEELLRSEEHAFSRAASEPGSARVRLHTLIDHLFDGFPAWASTDSVVFDLRGIEDAQFKKFYKKIRAHLTRLIRRGQEAAEFDTTLDPEHAAACIVGLIDGLLLQYMADRHYFSRMRGWRETAKLSVTRFLVK